MDEVKIIDDNGQIVGFEINGQVFKADGRHVVAQIIELEGFNIGSIPNGFFIIPLDGNTIIFEGELTSSESHPGVAYIGIYRERIYWYHKFSASQYFEAMREVVLQRAESDGDVEFEVMEDHAAYIFFRYRIFIKEDMPIDVAINKFKEIVSEIEGHTERILNREEIPPDILDDETKFTLEILLPLLRSMGFVDIKYNHGTREFGKDITFSEINQWGIRRNYGAQVKAGDLSGEASSELNGIIGQINDAFTMPYIDTSSRERRYVSELLIVISGRYVGNAKDKILEKASNRNIYFIDIDKIQEMLSKYLGKKIVSD